MMEGSCIKIVDIKVSSASNSQLLVIWAGELSNQ